MGDSEKVVEGVSGPCPLEFQPKKEVNPPAGDLGFPDCPLLSGRLSWRYKSVKSSCSAPSTLSLRSGGLVSEVYGGILGCVGDREWIILPFTVRSSGVVGFTSA